MLIPGFGTPDLVATGPGMLALAIAGGHALMLIWVSRQDYFFGREHFQLCAAAMIGWLLGAAVEQTCGTLPCVVGAASVTWLAIVIAPTSWFFFLWRYCLVYRPGKLKHDRAVMAVVGGIAAAVVASNPWHGAFYGPETRQVMADGRLITDFDHGPLFFALAAVLYVFLIAALVVAAIAAFRARGAMRSHFLFLTLATAAPAAANISYVAFDARFLGFDPTPYAFSVTLLVFVWSVYTSRMFDINMIARDIVFFKEPDPVVVLDTAGRVSALNPAGRRLLPDIHVGTLLPKAHPLAFLLHPLQDDSHSPEEPVIDIAGRVLRVRVLPIRQPLRKNGGAVLGVVGRLNDITELRAQERQLCEALALTQKQVTEITALQAETERLALTDTLTGLKNLRALEASFMQLQTTAPQLVLALLDLDNFKQINDLRGHAAGDRALMHFSAVVMEVLPPQALAFRVSGDEFVLLFPGFTLEKAAHAVDALRARIDNRPAIFDGVRLDVQFSVGLAEYGIDGKDLDVLRGVADRRLYAAKRTGRNRNVLDDVEARRSIR
ncbi:MAG: histidine kinase N-terminal 7TM domain-containing diguanylate cyclase [Pararhodobacter sp.]